MTDAIFFRFALEQLYIYICKRFGDYVCVIRRGRFMMREEELGLNGMTSCESRENCALHTRQVEVRLN